MRGSLKHEKFIYRLFRVCTWGFTAILFAVQASPIVDVAPLDNPINSQTAQQEQFTKIKVVEIPKAVADKVKAVFA
ncbi:MAG: hypothetical protein ACRDD8_10730 [Bacteroidales bacterium]